MPAWRPVSLCLVVCFLLATLSVATARPLDKKLIEYGWDVPPPSFVAANIEKMEQRPFEGLIMRVPKICSVFNKQKLTEADVAGELEALAQIKWSRFTDNFLIMYAASTMDWFSDDDWECVLNSVGLCAKAARIGGCKGVCFDAEPYGNNPWRYSEQARAATKTFAEYQAQVRKRGAQFSARIQQEMPQAVIHTFFLLSYFGGLGRETDPAERDRALSEQDYGLLPAFLNGMLDAAGPGLTITDGNEGSYYYTGRDQFLRARKGIHYTALGLVAPENRRKYITQVQCSQALYVDQLFALRTGKFESSYMEPQERAKWFEHNTFWALCTADEYVWLYSEKMNWWDGSELPEGLEGAVIAAKERLAESSDLGWDIKPIIEKARRRADEEIRARLGERTADVAPLGPGEKPPTIDGALDDTVWQRVQPLDAFTPYANQDAVPDAPTDVRVAYDPDNLYLAIRCSEPIMDKLRVVGHKRDEDVWLGDSVDLFFSTTLDTRTPFHHIILNPENASWDARQNGEMDNSWNPALVSAAAKEADAWTLELAVPWEAIGVARPVAGTRIAANICRQRMPKREHSSWSTCVSGFQEPLRFGVWTLR